MEHKAERPVIIEATTDSHFAEARTLFEEYAESIGVDLCFQDFSRELDSLPKMYGAPTGCLLLAQQEHRKIGCGAYRRVNELVCEMKRLYVRPVGRGLGLGRTISTALITRARAAGYQKMILDTLPSMKPAQALYRNLGFRSIEPYYDNPNPGVIYMGLEL